MTGLALALVLSSALAHAGWNFLAKRAESGMVFVWLFCALGALIYLPLAAYLTLTQPTLLNLTQMATLVVAAMLHTAYYFAMERGYRAGDLSLVYPLARGIGPIITTVGAVALLGERPGGWVLVGTVLIVAGAFILTGNPRRLRHSVLGPAIGFGLMLGLIGGAGNLWDKRAVSAVMVSPVLLMWFSNLFRTVVMAPYVWRERETLRELWRTQRPQAIGIAVLDSLSYILFLVALTFSPISTLGPLRQLSILIGAYLGTRLLSEEAGRRRLTASLVMVTGVIVLALGA